MIWYHPSSSSFHPHIETAKAKNEWKMALLRLTFLYLLVLVLVLRAARVARGVPAARARRAARVRSQAVATRRARPL